jgi:Mlc titration factor MtfA (ptsG expression regulator)
MEDMAVFILAILLSLLVVCMFITHFVSAVIEPVYMAIYKRPVYVYFYPVLKKISDSQRHILESNSPFYRRQTDLKKKYFEHRVAEFLNTYPFYGKDNLTITDEIKVMVSATYVMLTFGMRDFKFDVFDKIIIYPDTYHSTLSDEEHKGEFNPQYKAVVFSWKHFKEGYEIGSDNLNLGIHEFAHALHYYGLKRRDNGAAIFAHEYERVMKEIKHPANAKKLIDSQYFRIYGYTNQFEFVAVLLEHFFETPQAFRKEFPVLYDHVKIMINFREDRL